MTRPASTGDRRRPWPRRVDGIAGAALMAAVLLLPLAAGGPPASRIPRVGILRPGSPPEALVESFRQGLRDLGYTEGQTITLVERWAGDRDDRLAGLAADLVRSRVDVIVAAGSQALLV